MLIFFEPGSMCELQKDLVIAPLPARKQLWEVNNERTWEEVARKDNGIDASLALTAEGELVQLDEGQLYCDTRVLRYRISLDQSPISRITDWENWCSGTDGFGSLIMLAASLMM